MVPNLLQSAASLSPEVERQLGVLLVGTTRHTGLGSETLEPPASGPLVSELGLLLPRSDREASTRLHRELWKSWALGDHTGLEASGVLSGPLLERVTYARAALVSHWEALLQAELVVEFPPAVALLRRSRHLDLPEPYSALPQVRSDASAALFLPGLAARALRSTWFLNFRLPSLILPAEPGDSLSVLEVALTLWEDAGCPEDTLTSVLSLARSCTRQDPHHGGGPDARLSCGSPRS